MDVWEESIPVSAEVWRIVRRLDMDLKFDLRLERFWDLDWGWLIDERDCLTELASGRLWGVVVTHILLKGVFFSFYKEELNVV